ncbi:MAG TPA: hypothetical protein DCR43_02900 [Bacteroidales bacterium]|nr:hypothetical protein [Bacteroidales bacterium]
MSNYRVIRKEIERCPMCGGDIFLNIETKTNTGSFRPTKNLKITKKYLCMCGHIFETTETTEEVIK